MAIQNYELCALFQVLRKELPKISLLDLTYVVRRRGSKEFANAK
jgi:hypothetical protein